MLVAYFLNWGVLPESFNEGQLDQLKRSPIIFRQSSEVERRTAMNLDLKLVFKDTNTTFKALASGVSGYFFFTFFVFLQMNLMERFKLKDSDISLIHVTSFFIFGGVSFFTWVFTDCMMRKLVIFISLILMTPALLAYAHPDLFVPVECSYDTILTLVKGSTYTIAACFPLLQVPLVPEIISNIKTFRQTQFDRKVNDFGAAVHFAFASGGSTLASFVMSLTWVRDSTGYDILLAVTVTFWICYASYVDIKSTCRKDREEEEAEFQKAPENRPQAYKAYPEV